MAVRLAAVPVAAKAAGGAAGAKGAGAAGGAAGAGGAGRAGRAGGGGAGTVAPEPTGGSSGLRIPNQIPLDWMPQGDRREDGDAGGPNRIAMALLGGLGLLLLLVFLLFLPLFLIAGIVGGDEATRSELYPEAGSILGIPAGAIPFQEMYLDAAKVYGVNPYLLMAVHEDESDYSRSRLHGVSNYLNFDGCCAGPMQFWIDPDSANNTIGGRGGTWAGYANAYKRATIRRPASYPNRYAPHPNVYDSFDSIYAAAAYFKKLGAGPQLDERTLDALRYYKGRPPGSEPYARSDYARAQELERGAQVTGSHLQRIIEYANRIDAMDIPYCWAGGHRAKPGPSYIYNNCWREGKQSQGRNFSDVGLDCSGSVRWLLVFAGYPDQGPLHSSQFAYAYPRGRGRYVTIWSNDGHVFIEIDGRDWGTSYANHSHGPGWASHSKAGFTPSHPPGL